MKKKWWILAGFLLSLAVCLCFFGVRLRLAPRWILSRSMGNAITQLETRFQNSPIHLLEGVVNPEGEQKLELQLETKHRNLGPVHYDMTLQTQLMPNRIYADGTVVADGKALDLSLYLDENFAAVSSDDLVAGNNYGITYDTFSRDIRDRQLLAAILGDKTIAGLESSVASLQEKMSMDLTLPEFSLNDIYNALYGILAMKPRISREEILLPTAGDHKGYVVSFGATGAEIYEASQPYREQLTPELLGMLDKMGKDPESKVSVKFSLYKGKLIQILGQLENATETYECLLYLGEDPEEKSLSLGWNVQTGEVTKKFSVMIRTESDEESYEELLYFVKTENGVKESTSLDYQWDLSSGDMELEVRRGERKAEQRLNLTGEGETITIRAQNIRPLLNFLLEQEKVKPAICTLSVSPGNGVAVPEYRNLDQWSMEDLLALLSGFGGLIGLKMP